MLSYALRLAGDRGHAEDIVQDVFLTVWRKAAAFVVYALMLAATAWLFGRVPQAGEALDVGRTRLPGCPARWIVRPQVARVCRCS